LKTWKALHEMVTFGFKQRCNEIQFWFIFAEKLCEKLELHLNKENGRGYQNVSGMLKRDLRNYKKK
jgi:hypothetical protein